MAKKLPVTQEPEKPIPSGLSLWMENALPGWALPVLLVVLVVGGGALYIFDLIPERMTAIALAVGVSIGGAWFVGKDLATGAQARWQRLAGLGVGVVVFALTLTPALLTIMPGEPIVTGAVKAVGDKISLPPSSDGHVRLLVHGRLGGAGEATVTFNLKGGDQEIPGKLERTQSTTRAGRRGYSTVSHENNSTYLSAVLPNGVTEISLTDLEGNLSGDLQILVFRDNWPVLLNAILALIVLAAVAFLAVRQNIKSSAAAIAGLSLGFGIFVQLLATPDVAVRAQIGALILAAIGGSVIGTLFNFFAKRLVPKPS